MNRFVLSFLLIVAGNVFAADDPAIAVLQAELQATREQREEAQNKVAAIIAQANQRIAALQKRIEELTPKPEKK